MKSRATSRRTSVAPLAPALRPPPSVIKWSGGKRFSARYIAGLLPTANHYFEPFLGGGSVLFCRDEPASTASDLYAPLVEFWQLVKHDPAAVIDHYTRQWRALQRDRPGYFYAVRERFNRSPNGLDLCFLSRTCVNGIIRFNDDGAFNNSFHLSRRGVQPERFRVAVTRWTERLRTVEVRCGDYRETVARARRGDLVYLDPPYAGSTQRYIADLDSAELLKTLEALNRRDVRWALSFDGTRGESDYRFAMPRALFKRELDIPTGLSAVTRVLHGTSEPVTEKLYLNF